MELMRLLERSRYLRVHSVAWWKNGGRMVEEWWKNDGGMVEEWWRNGGKTVEEQ